MRVFIDIRRSRPNCYPTRKRDSAKLILPLEINMDLNRRTFLQSSLAATGGLIATGFAPSAFSAQGLSVPSSTKGALTL